MSSLPVSGGGSTQPVAIEGRPAAAMSEQPETAVRVITPGLLSALRIRVPRGRDFSAADRADGASVVLVSESMARRFWPGEEALGKRLTLTFYPGISREVVGVVYGVSATDPSTFLAVSALLTLVALAACALPAYRATRVDPSRALAEG